MQEDVVQLTRLLTLQIQEDRTLIQITTPIEEAITRRVLTRTQIETRNLIQIDAYNLIQEETLNLPEQMILVLEEVAAQLEAVAIIEAVAITPLLQAEAVVQLTRHLPVLQALHHQPEAQAVRLQDLLHLQEVQADRLDVVGDKS